jgi:hypothetical protein
MTDSGGAVPVELECGSDELRTLFLFEKLTDAQLDWLCQRGRVEVIPAGPVYAEGDPATHFYVLLDGTLVLSRRIGGDDSVSRRRSGTGFSSRSSPPNQWARAPGSASTSPSALWSTSITATSGWSRFPATPGSGSGCRSPRADPAGLSSRGRLAYWPRSQVPGATSSRA